jgi:hypothetical protein
MHPEGLGHNNFDEHPGLHTLPKNKEKMQH